MGEMINNIGNRMVTKARLVNRLLKDQYNGEWKGSLRSNCFYSEFAGMRQMLDTMNIEYDIEYELDMPYLKMVALVIMGKRFEI